MGDFKRSPSKVYWSEESSSWRFHASASPGSQDSGFSDTEASPPVPSAAPRKSGSRPSTPERANGLKGGGELRNRNLNGLYKEKSLPDKKISLRAKVENLSKSLDLQRKQASPVSNIQTQTPRKPLYQKRSRKNLFTATSPPSSAAPDDHQYAKGGANRHISSEVTFDRSDGVLLGAAKTPETSPSRRLNRSAPAVLDVLEEDGEGGEEEGEESDRDSEIEGLFLEAEESPRHTSTPKMRQRSKRGVQMRYHQQERVPPVDLISTEENPSVRRWLQNIRELYEAECMTTLQCKSISAELTQKVLSQAARITSSVRQILKNSQMVEVEFNNLKSQAKYKGPLAQNLACTLSELALSLGEEADTGPVYRLCDALRRATIEDIPRLSLKLYESWRKLQSEVLVKEVLRLAEKLENPTSELEFRATVTGITSLCLRNEGLIEIFVNAGAVSTLVVFCEKCDGSSVRIAILRALSTVCCSGTAVRQLEKASGIQQISDILSDQSRPEPELSETVALLAQVTAPWIDGNQNLHGLQSEGKNLVAYLTKFLSATKCCQNLLLCTAALANMTSMDSKCIKHLLHQNTVRILFESLEKRGPRTSTYLLEQVAILLANMSASEDARKVLTEEKAPGVLLCFLQTGNGGEEVERRLQQKAIIALSRLCSEQRAAEQLVGLGGVKKLVRLCREKKERYNSDAVLVAALATLRKVVDNCGSSVISAHDAQELVEPRLLDSFLAYSTQNESYV